MQILQALWYNDHCTRRLMPPNVGAFVRPLFPPLKHVVRWHRPHAMLIEHNCEVAPFGSLTRIDVTSHNDHVAFARSSADVDLVLVAECVRKQAQQNNMSRTRASLPHVASTPHRRKRAAVTVQPGSHRWKLLLDSTSEAYTVHQAAVL